MSEVVNLFEDENASELKPGDNLRQWVQGKADEWRHHYEQNYQEKHQEYHRMWRGQWAPEDKQRESEKSKIVTPGLSQAVEENTAEVEEATFTGKFFDIRDDVEDQDPRDIEVLRTKLEEDMKTAKVKPEVSACILNAAVYGTAAAELVLTTEKVMAPAVREAGPGQGVVVGVESTERTVVKLDPVLPQNGLCDPNATSPHTGMGFIVDKFVGKETVAIMQEEGIYRDVEIGTAPPDQDLEPAQDELGMYQENRVRLTKYFGLVPRHMLETALPSEDDEDVEDLVAPSEDSKSYYVEAIVVLGNGHLLKAEENPYMMKDRPIVSFQWDLVPGRYHGRGVCEKGYNVQKAIDVEVRARIDALALTIHPMLAIDSTRMPRGAKPQVRPGKMLSVLGNPSEILKPFNFGAVDQINFVQAEALGNMLRQATGAVDGASLPNAVAGGDVKSGAMAMALGAVMKRHKRTLLSFQHCFLIPMVEKMAWRYMQFEPERYPIGDYNFHAEGSLGFVAREYETAQLLMLLQTMGPDSPLYAPLLSSIVDNMNVSNRETILAALEQASQPDPEAQQRAQEAHAAEMQVQRVTVDYIGAQANEANANADLKKVQARVDPYEAETQRIKVAALNMSPDDDGGDKEFEQRLRLLQELREDRKLNIAENESRERIAEGKAARQREEDARAEKEAEKAALSNALNG